MWRDTISLFQQTYRKCLREAITATSVYTQVRVANSQLSVQRQMFILVYFPQIREQGTTELYGAEICRSGRPALTRSALAPSANTGTAV